MTVQPAEELTGSTDQGSHYVRIRIANEGGLVLPVHLAVTYDDGSTERLSLPADVWRNNERAYTKGFFTDKTVTRVELDPDQAFADINRENNVWDQLPLNESEVRN